MHSRWNSPIIKTLVEGCLKSLRAHDVLEKDIAVISVPGAWELPLAVQQEHIQGMNESYDAIIAIGVLIKGETMHFEYISEATTQGLMRVQLDTGVPVVLGVLTVLTEEQAWERAGVHTDGSRREGREVHNHGEEWGAVAIEVATRGRRPVR